MNKVALLGWFPLVYGFIDEQPAEQFTKDALLARLREEVSAKKPFREFAQMFYWFVHGKKDGLPVFECVEILGKEKTLNLIRFNFNKLMEQNNEI